MLKLAQALYQLLVEMDGFEVGVCISIGMDVC